MDFLGKAKSKFDSVATDVKKASRNIADAFEGDKHSHTHFGESCHLLHHHTKENRYHSFAPPRTANDAKWFVDGCGYMWAVSVALEEAKESIWILDWWLSPELYLRRPPSKNEEYRLDRMIIAAAKRGVKVNIIVYKEVEGVLTRKSPTKPSGPESISQLTSMQSYSGLCTYKTRPRSSPKYCSVPTS